MPLVPTPTTKMWHGWDKRLQELKKFKQEHGHCNVLKQHPGGLGYWVADQRRCGQEDRRRRDTGQTQKLEELGFQWRVGKAKAVAPPAKKAPRGPPKARAPPPPPAKKAPAPAKKKVAPPAKAKSPAPAKKSPAPAKKAAAPPAPAPAKKATPAKKAAAPAKKSRAVKKAKTPPPANKATPAKKAAPPLAKKPNQLEQDQAQVGKRVAKDFGGEVYGGTVKKFTPQGRLWAIVYDDGDKEEMDAKELAAALKLQEKEKK